MATTSGTVNGPVSVRVAWFVVAVVLALAVAAALVAGAVSGHRNSGYTHQSLVLAGLVAPIAGSVPAHA